jgi:hypothetical protein
VNLLFFAADPEPAGLALGRFPVPAWVIWVVSALVVAFAASFLLARARRSKGPRKGAQ